MLYEALLVFAVAFFAAWLFFFASGGREATEGWLRLALQLFVGAVIASYFLWCWLRGGQTLAMRAWRIRLAFCRSDGPQAGHWLVDAGRGHDAGEHLVRAALDLDAALRRLKALRIEPNG